MGKKKILICVFILFLCLGLFLDAQAQAQEKGRGSSGLEDYQSAFMTYLNKEREAKDLYIFTGTEYLGFFAIDLALSLACLLAAILLLTAVKNPFLKTFPWFLFILNFTWSVFLMLSKLIWQGPGNMLTKLQPDLAGMLVDNFTLVVLACGCLIYIWLLARTFGLSLFGALGIFFTSHLLYFLIIFLIFSFAFVNEDRFFNLLKENLGVRPVIRSYLLDVNKITSNRSFLELIRIRPYHL